MLPPVGSDWITDTRRASAAKAAKRARFEAVRRQIPDLIADLRGEIVEHPLIRDFLIVPNKDCMFGSDTPAFFYYETEYPEAAQQTRLLAAHGYVEDIQTGHFAKYRITESFVEHLRA
jgi:hypothetical protein